MNLRKILTGREQGQTLVEYGLIISFFSVLMIGALMALQVGIEDYYTKLADTIKAVI